MHVPQAPVVNTKRNASISIECPSSLLFLADNHTIPLFCIKVFSIVSLKGDLSYLR